jgi:hypothetical protein
VIVIGDRGLSTARWGRSVLGNYIIFLCLYECTGRYSRCGAITLHFSIGRLLLYGMLAGGGCIFTFSAVHAGIICYINMMPVLYYNVCVLANTVL